MWNWSYQGCFQREAERERASFLNATSSHSTKAGAAAFQKGRGAIAISSQRVRSFQENVIASNKQKTNLDESFVGSDYWLHRPCVFSSSHWSQMLLIWSCPMPAEGQGMSQLFLWHLNPDVIAKNQYFHRLPGLGIISGIICNPMHRDYKL